MRRPVKPFVTEYRGTLRRTKDAPYEGSEPKPDNGAARSRSFAEANKLFKSEPAEDGYEAALRAADALFSNPARSAPGFDLAFPDATVAAGARPGGRDNDTGPNAQLQTRRILQAIEPEQPDPLAAIEAERGPKRRGRKPGSKNKPRAAVAEPAEAGLPAARPDLAPPTVGPAVAELAFDMDQASEEDGDGSGGHQPRSRNTRFGWKRAGLRPGERWKRRLPKVAR